MNAAALRETIAVGAITGMRSMAGPALLARRHGGVLSGVLPLMAAGEMVLDKTSVVGDRTDAVPLAGRALMGAVVGGYIARQNGGHVVAGAAIGAATAIVAAHLAMRIRQRLPLSTAAGGALEDAIVMGIGALYAGRPRR